jgi:hypothetical protein
MQDAGRTHVKVGLVNPLRSFANLLTNAAYKMNISQELFTKFHTPDKQTEFFNAVNNYIDNNK